MGTGHVAKDSATAKNNLHRHDVLLLPCFGLLWKVLHVAEAKQQLIESGCRKMGVDESDSGGVSVRSYQVFSAGRCHNTASTRRLFDFLSSLRGALWGGNLWGLYCTLFGVVRCAMMT